MTYSGFLLRFLVPPIVLLGLFLSALFSTRQRRRPIKPRRLWTAVGIHILLALIYTTPWDNYLVASGVWYYNPQLVTGWVIGYVPVEEYAFFILETIFVGLWWGTLTTWTGRAGSSNSSGQTQTGFKASPALRIGALTVLVLVWLVSAYLLIAGAESFTYLSLILFWALPAIAPQLWFGADILWHQRGLLALIILPMGVYLSLADSVAIAAFIWTISPAQSTGWLIGNHLPAEEAVFFFITVTLIAFGMQLLLAEESRARIDAWLAGSKLSW